TTESSQVLKRVGDRLTAQPGTFSRPPCSIPPPAAGHRLDMEVGSPPLGTQTRP
ncbi:hypothetical protein NQZ68_040691, partial [Dissostichus eleginoides]